MKNFKAIITTNKNEKVGRNQQKIVVDAPFNLKVEIDSNNQIADVQPHIFKGVDLLSKYHGRPYPLAINELANEMYDLNKL